jgi:putative SOS response-associated peptidase YedK
MILYCLSSLASGSCFLFQPVSVELFRYRCTTGLPISWNIAPTQDVLANRLHSETKQRTLDTLRWGLIPNWAKDPKIAYKTINARAESVDTAPSFRQAFI